MASDADASRHKHRRSPSDDDVDKSSKRHKHRPHRHRHHHHRSHRSKKHDEESKQDGDETALPSPPPVHVTDFGSRSDKIDDDVEEGEILEEEGSGGVGVKDYQLRDQEVGSQNLEFNAINNKGDFINSNNGTKFDGKVSLPKDSWAKSQDELAPRDALKFETNGDLDHDYHGVGRKQYAESSSSKGSHKQKIYGDADKPTPEYENRLILSDLGKSSSFENEGNKTESESRSIYHDEVIARSRSLSRDVSRDRSRSRSVVEEEVILKRRRHHDRLDNVSDDETIAKHHRDLQHGSRDLDRENSTGYTRKLGRGDKHSSLDAHGRGVDTEKEMEKELKGDQERERIRDMDKRRKELDRSRDRDWRREKDRERSRDGDLRREKERESRDRDLRREKDRERSKERDQKRVKERERSRDRDQRREEQERSRDRDKRREERERSRGTEMDRDWRREKQRDRSLDKQVDRDWRREKEVHRNRDREEELEQKRQKDREKIKDKETSRASDKHRDRDGEKDRYRESERRMDRDWDSERERGSRGVRNREKARDIKSNMGKEYNSHDDFLEGNRGKLARDEKEQDDFEERITIKLAEQEEDLDRVKEESRKRRQAILEKYKNQQLQQQNETQSERVKKDVEPAKATMQSSMSSDIPLEAAEIKVGGHAYVAESSFSVDKLPPENGKEASDRPSGAVGLGEGTPKSEGSDGKYCDDIFGETPTGVRKSGKGDGLPIMRSGLHDNWDDADGYYGYRFGEILDGRYEIVAAHGKGVFSTVVRAKDLKAGTGDTDEVAIKIIRNNETMHKAGQTEVQILNKLAETDRENKRHCVRFLSSFKYRNHLCLVFESLNMNLREVLKRFGRNIGLKLTAVRAYAKQLFIALKHLKNCGVLHCDIKPDNMLVNEAKNVLKLCDFGNAMFSGKNEVTPYLVSRFYRAPEIILGLQYDHPLDIWSVGCCLYELYTGKVLFPGPTNNDMLRLHMELKGPFPKKMLRKGAFIDQHFDHDLNFHAIEEDPVTKKAIKRMILNVKPKDIGSIIPSSPGEDAKMLANFKDLLDKIFALDPEKRMTVQLALQHPFITGK